MTAGVVSTYRSAVPAPPRATQVAYRAAVIMGRAWRGAPGSWVRRGVGVAGAGLVVAVAAVLGGNAVVTGSYDLGIGLASGLASVWAMQGAVVILRAVLGPIRRPHPAAPPAGAVRLDPARTVLAATWREESDHPTSQR